MIKSFADPSIPHEPVHAYGLQIDCERIAGHLATHQSVAVTNLIRDKKSFGTFSPRRCDVYIFVGSTLSLDSFRLFKFLSMSSLFKRVTWWSDLN